MSDAESQTNYFAYFSEIEEHFQQVRQSGGFLLSPLDWALIESWKEADIPLEAVHKGIDRAFEKWSARKRKFRTINSLAYCAQEVLEAAREIAEGGSEAERRSTESSFQPEELKAFFGERAEACRAAQAGASDALRATLASTAESLDKLAQAASEGPLDDLEAVEQRLTVLEDRLVAALTQAMSEDEMVEARTEMERQLGPHRRKMTADQLEALERRYLRRDCLERAGVPRLSLFYL